jgi:hypothetical protein
MAEVLHSLKDSEDKMHRITVLIAVLACCECATLRDEVSPIVKTDLDLTAHNSEVGNWTADLGDMQVR